MSLGAGSSRLTGSALWLMLHARRYHLIQSISAITLLQLQILWDPLVSALLRQSVQLPRTSGFRDCCCFYRQSLLIYCDLRCNSPLDVADAVDDISVCVFVVSKEKNKKIGNVAVDSSLLLQVINLLVHDLP